MRSDFTHIFPLGRPLIIWGFSSYLAFGAMQAQAASCPTTPVATIVVSSSCDTTIEINAANSPATVTINGGASVATLENSVYVNNGGSIATLTNNGEISPGQAGAGYGVYNAGAISSFTNRGNIQSGNVSLIYNDTTGVITSFTNSGHIYTLADMAIENRGLITSFTNTSDGIIQTDASAPAFINNGTINLLNNAGSIFNNNSSNGILNGGTISTLTNTGSIYGDSFYGAYDISNSGFITNFNNGQGGNSSSAATTALAYTGRLPSNYNIIVTSTTHYGQLNVVGGLGNTTFGISPLSGTGKTILGSYASVITGVSNVQLGVTGISKTGNSNGYGYVLSEATLTSNIWDLLITSAPFLETGPSVANTNQSLVNTASALQGTYTLQNSVLANSFSYDCNVFGANNVCVSAGGRNTQVQATNGLNNTSALLVAAYRLTQNYRIGAYADQNLSASNPGGTVNLGNNTPLIGLFGAWNERLDGAGTEVKVSAAYGQKNTTITRSVVGSGTGASEAGSGSSTLNSQGVQATAKYGFAMIDNVIVSPYVGVRYTQNNMGGYTEVTSSSVTAPLTYNALNTNATTALAGVGASYRVIPTVTTFASAGVETDTNTSNSTYSATNASIGILTPVNFNANPVRTRPTATLGAYYDVAKNQRLGVTGIYRQEAYQAVSTTTVMATYTIGL